MKKKFLVLDDQRHWRKAIQEVLEDKGHEVVTGIGFQDIYHVTDGNSDIDAVITDTRMPQAKHGIWVLQAINPLPCYIHSSEPTCNYEGRETDLHTFVPKYFGEFATFKEKPDLLDHKGFPELFAWINKLK